MSNFGASFRKAREAAGLPLDKLAGDTRISTRFLLAIESEEFHLLPGGIFNRGFIRAYAERLGMDPVQAVADYDSLSSAAEEPLEVLRNAELASTRKTERSFYPIAAAILVLLIGGYYVANRRYATKPEVAPAQPVVAPPASTPPPEVSAPSERALLPEPAATTAQAPTTLPAAAPATVPEASSAKAPVVALTPPPPVPIPIQQANQIPTTPAIVATPAPATLVAPAAASVTAVPTASVLVLDVNIKDVTWIRIAADGAVVLADNLQPGATRRISAERSLEITIGNAAGVGLKINGRDLGELGTNGRVRQFRITPENAARIQG